jgi:RNA polymerase sigma factor (sigma-70 family)
MSEMSYATDVLLKRASDGDTRALDELVNRYSRLLWSVGQAHRLDTADVADAVQTTWLRLVENLDRIEDPERLVGWLVTTMRRECLRILRRTDRERPHPPDLVAYDTPDPAEPVDAALIREERDVELWQAFDRLPDRCRRLLRLLMVSPPVPYEAIAALLEIPVGSIGPTRARCLSRLRAMLDLEGATTLLAPPYKETEERLKAADQDDTELWDAFGRLSDRQQSLLRRLIQGSPDHKTASELGIPAAAVGPARTSALARLHTLLGDSQHANSPGYAALGGHQDADPAPAEQAFAKAFRNAVASRGLSLRQLAQTLSADGVRISPATLSLWQNGHAIPNDSPAGRRRLQAAEHALNIPQGQLIVAWRETQTP